MEERKRSGRRPIKEDENTVRMATCLPESLAKKIRKDARKMKTSPSAFIRQSLELLYSD